MKFLKWVLTIFAVLVSLALLLMGDLISCLIALLAALLVAPPLKARINKRLPWLRFKFLKLLLMVILLVTALLLSGGNIVRFTDAAVCSKPSDGRCEQHEIAFMEKTQDIAVSASLREVNAAKKINVALEYWPEPKQETEVLNQTFDFPKGKKEVLLPLTNLDLKPGNYRITLTPEEIGRKEPLPAEQKFSVWTDLKDVKQRNDSDIENAGFNNSVTKVKICEGSSDATKPCAEDFQELSPQIKILSFTAEIPSLRVKRVALRGDSEITFILRYLGKTKDAKEKPIQLFRETSELDRKVGTYTLGFPAPAKGLPSGEFELITFLETRSSQPIRKQFTIK